MIDDQFSEIVAALGADPAPSSRQAAGALIDQATVHLGTGATVFELAMSQQRAFDQARADRAPGDEIPDEAFDLQEESDSGKMEALTRGVLAIGSSLLAIAQTLETIAGNMPAGGPAAGGQAARLRHDPGE